MDELKQSCIVNSYRVHKEIKNAPECIVKLYKHAGIFKNTREVHKARDVCTRTLSSYNDLELTNHSARIYSGIL